MARTCRAPCPPPRPVGGVLGITLVPPAPVCLRVPATERPTASFAGSADASCAKRWADGDFHKLECNINEVNMLKVRIELTTVGL